MRISLIFLGSRAAGPIYAFQMAQALHCRSDVQLQIVISKESDNVSAWDAEFQKDGRVEYQKIDTYKHSKIAVALSLISYRKISRLVKIVRDFHPDVTYFPFGCMWSWVAYPAIHRFSKIVTTYHDPHPYSHGYILSQFILVFLGKSTGRYSDGLIILNEKDKEFVEKKYNKQVCVIPHAAFSYLLNDTYQLSSTIHKCIAFMGRIEAYKGLDVLVEAFEKLKTPGIKLLIAGSGNIDSNLLQRIENNPNIELKNRFIKNEEIPAILEKIDMLVLPYKDASQSGVIPMAFAFGKTVVSTNVGALSEQVPEGTGVLTSVDSSAIASAIDSLYANQTKIIEYGRNAKEYADTHLSWNSSANALVSFCQSIW